MGAQLDPCQALFISVVCHPNIFFFSCRCCWLACLCQNTSVCLAPASELLTAAWSCGAFQNVSLICSFLPPCAGLCFVMRTFGVSTPRPRHDPSTQAVLNGV